MVFESPQSELRFESYGQNKQADYIGCDSHPTGATRTQNFDSYTWVRLAPNGCDSHPKFPENSRLVAVILGCDSHPTGATRTQMEYSAEYAPAWQRSYNCSTGYDSRPSGATRTHQMNGPDLIFGCDLHPSSATRAQRVRLAPGISRGELYINQTVFSSSLPLFRPLRLFSFQETDSTIFHHFHRRSTPRVAAGCQEFDSSTILSRIW